MTSSRVLTIVILLGTLFLTSPSGASVPDPGQSEVPLWDMLNRALVVPGDYTDGMLITVRDAAGDPLPNVWVEIEFTDCPALCFDDPDPGLSGYTDDEGNVRLGVRVGGCQECDVIIWADAVVLRSYPLVVSPDWDGEHADGLVCRADWEYFLEVWDTDDTCADYDGSGWVEAGDLTLFLSSYGRANHELCDNALPDPDLSTIEPWTMYGQALACPGAQGGYLYDVTIEVRDASGDPIPHAWVEVLVYGCDDLCLDEDGAGLGARADANGVAVLAPRVGGCQDCNVVVTANCQTLQTFSRIVSPDWDGMQADGQVCDADVEFFQGAYMSGYAPCADYDGDGDTDGNDLTFFAPCYGSANVHVCSPTLPYAPNCSVDPWDDFGQVRFCPGVQDAGLDDVTIVIRNEYDPIPNVLVEIDLVDCEGLCIDEPETGLSGYTDADGVVVLDPRVGGCEDCDVVVKVECVPVRTYSRVVSPDWNGEVADGVVAGDDLAFFMEAFTTTGDLCADYDGDGEVDTDDMALINETLGDANSQLCGTASVEGERGGGDAVSSLQFFQNPAVRTVTVVYALAGEGMASLEVFDHAGRLVRSLLNEGVSPGQHEIQWDGTGADGGAVPSGVYFIRLSSADGEITKRALMLR